MIERLMCFIDSVSDCMDPILKKHSSQRTLTRIGRS
jgi:hypothetical protein